MSDNYVTWRSYVKEKQGVLATSSTYLPHRCITKATVVSRHMTITLYSDIE